MSKYLSNTWLKSDCKSLFIALVFVAIGADAVDPVSKGLANDGEDHIQAPISGQSMQITFLWEIPSDFRIGESLF